MRQGDKLSATADIKKSQEQFRAPDKASAAHVGGESSKSNAPSTLTRRTGTPGSSFSTSRSWRRGTLPPGSRHQPTLTQIDFVTPIAQNPPSDDGLDYIPESRPDPKDVIEIEDDSDDNDADYQPSSHRRSRRSLEDRSEQATVIRDPQKKTTTPRDTKRGRRKSGEKPKSGRKEKAKKEKQRHKTLTQMDYVRRYLKIEPDDEVKLEYTYITPKKSEPETGDHKRRKVDNDCTREHTTIPAEDKKAALPHGPTTPKKHKRAVIPSSQSPESPGLAVISPSQFGHDAHSPLKRLAPLTANHRIKEESPELGSTKMRAWSPEMVPFPSSDSQKIPKAPSSASHQVALSPKAHIDAPATQYPSGEERTLPIKGAVHVDDPTPQPTHKSRTVVYETDADTDYGESEDDVPSPVAPAEDRGFPDNDYTHIGSDDMGNGDSLDLPPITQSQRHVESEIPASETNLPSDASIFYQRLQPTTQFPMEPLPDLNTQKLAELFPEASNAYDTSAIRRLPQSSPLATSRVQSGATQTQTETQSQSQSQDVDPTPAEMVPESSPIMRNGSERHHPIDQEQESQSRDAIVQVESSQAVDRAYRQSSMGHKARSRGILSGSDLLTSSVMESVPLPAFWFGSQDSVGEPYNSSEA
ncbi:hypothetical protein HFD88_008787 [Aspergillus terreus]|nr:hypothetical protein HFD88_008787 [Aspergillus terreus]